MQSIFFLGDFGHASCERYVFQNRQSAVGPTYIAGVAESTCQRVDLGHCGIKWETREIGLGGESFVVTSLEIFQGSRSWFTGCEMMEGTEETIGGRCRELFQPLDDHHLAVADTDAPDEYGETIYNEGGVEVGKIRQ
jgi:hypothetical protein